MTARIVIGSFRWNQVKQETFISNLKTNCMTHAVEKKYHIYPKYSDTSTPYHTCSKIWTIDYLGPVVQRVVSLTSALRVISLTVLADSIYNILIFFAEKTWVAFALQKLLTFFSKKFQHICISLDENFNESLTNDIVSFEQLGPDVV